jgi:hypothetical protein
MKLKSPAWMDPAPDTPADAAALPAELAAAQPELQLATHEQFVECPGYAQFELARRVRLEQACEDDDSRAHGADSIRYH